MQENTALRQENEQLLTKVNVLEEELLTIQEQFNWFQKLLFT